MIASPPVIAIDLDKDGLPTGYFSSADVHAYRELITRVPDGGIVVEIGVYKGRSLCSIGPSCRDRGIHIWAIDPWRNIDPVMRLFLNHLRFFKLEGTVIAQRTRSHALAPFFPNHSLDLVFVDGPHDYASVKTDLRDWIPKVKPGGWIAGHDYCSAWPDVARAVHEQFGPAANVLREDSAVWAQQL